MTELEKLYETLKEGKTVTVEEVTEALPEKYRYDSQIVSLLDRYETASDPSKELGVLRLIISNVKKNEKDYT